jgi:hypothetical protein
MALSAQRAPIPRAAFIGVAVGIFFMALFSTSWAFIGIAGLAGWLSPLFFWPQMVAVILGIAQLIFGIYVIVLARSAPETTKEQKQQGRKLWRLFGIVFGIEGLSIGILSAICGVTNQDDLLFPLMGLIVGLHFFPLAPIFRNPFHYVTGALLCLIPLVTLFVVPEHFTIGALAIRPWWIVVGIGTALVLYLTSLVMVATVARMVQVNNAPSLA